MGQVAFLIVFLLAFGKRKSVATFRASDLDVWHIAVLQESGTEVYHTLCSSGRERVISFRFYWPLVWGIRKSANAQTRCHGARTSETVKWG